MQLPATVLSYIDSAFCNDHSRWEGRYRRYLALIDGTSVASTLRLNIDVLLQIPKQNLLRHKMAFCLFKVDKIEKILLSLNHCKRPLLMTYYNIYLLLGMTYIGKM